MSVFQSNEYKKWFFELKETIQKRQIKAAISVNSELIYMYWDLGCQIVEKQTNTKWGSGFLEQLSRDLIVEFPNTSGFSRTNLFAAKKFYTFYSKFEIIPQVGGQIPEIIKLCAKLD